VIEWTAPTAYRSLRIAGIPPAQARMIVTHEAERRELLFLVKVEALNRRIHVNGKSGPPVLAKCSSGYDGQGDQTGFFRD
jgi:hypothetical protein